MWVSWRVFAGSSPLWWAVPGWGGPDWGGVWWAMWLRQLFGRQDQNLKGHPVARSSCFLINIIPSDCISYSINGRLWQHIPIFNCLNTICDWWRMECVLQCPRIYKGYCGFYLCMYACGTFVELFILVSLFVTNAIPGIHRKCGFPNLIHDIL